MIGKYFREKNMQLSNRWMKYLSLPKNRLGYYNVNIDYQDGHQQKRINGTLWLDGTLKTNKQPDFSERQITNIIALA